MFQKTKTKGFVALLLAFCLLAGGFSLKAQAAATASSKAAEIVRKNVKSGDSAKTKLKKMFQYVEKNYNYGRATALPKSYSDLEKDALEMFHSKKGSCYHYAAAYGFLAKKATGYQVRIGVGQTNGFNSKQLQGHAWTEVKIGSKWYVCDTNLDKYGAKSSKKYFLKKRNSLKKTYNKYKGVKYYTVK